MPYENIQWYRCEECYGLWRPEFLHRMPCACGKKHDVCVHCEERRRKDNPRFTETLDACPQFADGPPNR